MAAPDRAEMLFFFLEMQGPSTHDSVYLNSLLG